MGSLTGADAERLLAALPELYSVGPVEEFPARALALCRSLIGCADVSFNEIDLVRGSFRALADPPDDRHENLRGVFGQFIHQHPVLAHVAATGDARPLAISDFLDAAAFGRLALHGEFYAPLGIADQLSTTFSVIPGQVIVAVALDRDTEFGERERAILAALQPHLAAAYANSVRFSAALSGADGAGEQADEANCRLARLTDRQRELLSLIATGCTNAQVAYRLGLSVGTVKKHVENILERLGVETRLGAACLYLTATASAPEARWWTLHGEMAASG